MTKLYHFLRGVAIGMIALIAIYWLYQFTKYINEIPQNLQPIINRENPRPEKI